ncbi:uncharacterized protein LOC141684589 isoform X1 [Apium graveolens]|uniref:uncharacterized protein LOC141684589 isoform X1 n=2 Tax=Apium graveolens TaxID=4045 RepID=UPI003D78F344
MLQDWLISSGGSLGKKYISMMDFRGASWVGDIYQKFEAMCMEVEETICEDAVKFVESQVHNVGSNMKKFYTDVMQDLASTDSTAPVKLPVANLPLDSHADAKIDEDKKASNKKDSNKVVNLFTNDHKVIDREDGDQVSSLDEHVKLGGNSCSRGSSKISFSMQDTKGEQHEGTTVGCKKVPNKDCCQKITSKNQVLQNQDEASSVSEIIHEHATNEHMVLASPQASVEVVGWEWDSREEEKEIGSCEGFDVDDFTVHGPLSTDVLSSRTGEGLARDFIETDSSVKLDVLGDSKTCQLTGELVYSGKKNAGNEDVIENSDKTDLEADTTDDDEIKLEETCVFVNDNNVSFASYKDKQPWSYKKKMRDAFSLKKKLSRRQEYKKLVTQYGNANMSSSLTCVDTVTHTVSPESNKPELRTGEYCESDWELL